MGSDHASPEYLAGLSDLDRARAIVAVRWLGAGLEWQERRRSLGLDPIDTGGHRGNDWGTNWRGTGSLMELAEGKGWRMIGVSTNAEGADPVVLLGRDRLHIMGKADTIHAAVLLACAAAARREDNDGK